MGLALTSQSKKTSLPVLRLSGSRFRPSRIATFGLSALQKYSEKQSFFAFFATKRLNFLSSGCQGPVSDPVASPPSACLHYKSTVRSSLFFCIFRNYKTSFPVLRLSGSRFRPSRIATFGLSALKKYTVRSSLILHFSRLKDVISCPQVVRVQVPTQSHRHLRLVCITKVQLEAVFFLHFSQLQDVIFCPQVVRVQVSAQSHRHFRLVCIVKVQLEAVFFAFFATKRRHFLSACLHCKSTVRSSLFVHFSRLKDVISCPQVVGVQVSTQLHRHFRLVCSVKVQREAVFFFNVNG
jgi:hypothetical protein